MITATTSESSSLRADLNLGYIWLIWSVAALGGLLFGWDWVVIGILAAQVINWSLVRHLPTGASDEFIRNSLFGQQGWR